MNVARRLHDALMGLLHLERRIDPFFRPAFDAVLQEPLAVLAQAIVNAVRPKGAPALATEEMLPDEAGCMQSIIDSMAAYMHAQYRPGEFERAGNTKTHGVVRGCTGASGHDIP